MRFRPVLVPGMILGAALAIAVNAAVFQAMLGWHMFVCFPAGCQATTLSQFRVQSSFHGMVELMGILLAATGVAGLWRTAKRGDGRLSSRMFLGAVLMGLAGIALTEGLVAHHILGAHHVRPEPQPLAFDFGYLGVMALIFVGGWKMYRRNGGVSSADGASLSNIRFSLR